MADYEKNEMTARTLSPTGETAFKNGSLKPVPEPLVIGKGLEKIPEGIALCQQGISAGKVVVVLWI